MNEDERYALVDGFYCRVVALWAEVFFSGLQAFSDQIGELAELGLPRSEATDLAKKTLFADKTQECVESLWASFWDELSHVPEDEADSILEEVRQRVSDYLQKVREQKGWELPDP